MEHCYTVKETPYPLRLRFLCCFSFISLNVALMYVLFRCSPTWAEYFSSSQTEPSHAQISPSSNAPNSVGTSHCSLLKKEKEIINSFYFSSLSLPATRKNRFCAIFCIICPPETCWTIFLISGVQIRAENVNSFLHFNGTLISWLL